jgi:iron complex transport system ATP-binding protein
MVLRVRGLLYRHAFSRTPLIKAIDLDLEPGQILCLLGPNGTGKTTLMRCILGLLRPENGTIRIDGRTSLSARERARKIAYVPQFSADSALSLQDIVLMGRTPHMPPLAQPGRRDRSLALAALDRVGLEHLAHRAFESVSGGERQLTLIARALAQESKIFLMDEPTASLDLGNQVRVLRTIRDLAAEGMAIMFTSHQPEHAFLLGATVAVIKDGQIANVGPASEILHAEMLSDLYRTAIDIVSHKGAPTACVPRI